MLEVVRVAKKFPSRSRNGSGAFYAYRDVSFEVRDNEFVCLLGPSGCGKTTLLRSIAGLIPPSQGEILADGQRVERPGRDRSMVFQHFGLLPWRTVRANVELGLELQGVPRSERTRTAQHYIDLVGLGKFTEYYPHQLSGGMQQRVGIARALSMSPRMLLMDEPFSALDAYTRELLQEELLKIWGQTTATVLFVTHSIDEAVYLSDRVIVMTAHPGTVKAIHEVDLPRPRVDYEVKSHPNFIALRERLNRSLREEAVGV